MKRAEAKRAGKKIEDLEKEEARAEAELAKKDLAYQAALGAWKQFISLVPKEFHFPCYYDARKMGLWNEAKPFELKTQIDHNADSTRNVRFDRSDVTKEIHALATATGEQIPALKGKVDYLLFGPAGEPYASHDAGLRKQHKLRLGSKDDWQGVLGQKIPRFDNRILTPCALIPRLHVCRVMPKFKKAEPQTKRELETKSLLPAEVIFLMQAKNLQVDDKNTEVVRFLETGEIQELLDKATTDVLDAVRDEKTEAQILECYKITVSEWKHWCAGKNFRYLNDAQGTKTKNPAIDEEKSEGGKTTDIVKAPRPSGRSRFSRPALSILRHVLLNASPELPPDKIIEKLHKNDLELFDLLGLDVLEKEPLLNGKKGVYEKRPRTWILISDLVFLPFIWKQRLDDDKIPLSYSPNQIRIPDLALRFLRRKHEITNKPFSEILRDKDPEVNRRAKAILELIGEQNNPIVRDRLTRFWQRLLHFNNPVVNPDTKKQKPGLGLDDPECLVLEFVRDDEDNSLDGKARKGAIKDAIDNNTKERERIRKLLEDGNLPTSDDHILRRRLWEDQGCQCIYTGKGIGCTDYQNFELEHIIPRSKGGPDAYWNWVLADPEANAEKDSRTPYQWFHDEKADSEWLDYKNRVLNFKGKLGSRKADLLLSADAVELVGEKYTALADTAWISRLAQSIARLHFGWPLDDDQGKERVITISGGLTARIRRKYLLDSLLGPTNRSGEHSEDDPDPAVVRNRIDEALQELETLKSKHPTTDPELSEVKEERRELLQTLRDLAAQSNKNRKDKRHHALDAMLLTFLPNWARDKNKEDFFRLEEIGDNTIYSEEGSRRKVAHQERIGKLYNENEAVFSQIREAKKEGDDATMERLKKSILPARKEMAVLYQSIDKQKQPRNIKAVREWFKNQLATANDGNKVLPQNIARSRPEIEKTIYADRNMIQLAKQQKSVALCNFGLRPEFHDESISIFDARYLRTQLQAIIGIKGSKEKEALKKLKRLLHSKVSAEFPLDTTQWITFCEQSEVLSHFPKMGKNKTLPTTAECLLDLRKIEIWATSRSLGHTGLIDLAYNDGTSLVLDMEELGLKVPKFAKRIERPKKSSFKKETKPSTLVLICLEDQCEKWPGFVFDRISQSKITNPDFQKSLEELSGFLPGPKPKDKDAKVDWGQRDETWKQKSKEFLKAHSLPSNLFLYEVGKTEPRPREKSSIWGVLFRKVERQFSLPELKKQTKKITCINSAKAIDLFADSLNSIPQIKDQERLWKEFCSVWKSTTKQAWEQFESPGKLTSQKWIDFHKSQSGPLVHKIKQKKGDSLEKYFDLSKDGTGQWFEGNNQGYLLAKKGDKYHPHAIRFFEKESDVTMRLKRNQWELLDETPWRWGMLLKLEKQAGTEKRPILSGHYFFGSCTDAKVNLNSCFGEKVPQGISLKSLWENGLRRMTNKL